MLENHYIESCNDSDNSDNSDSSDSSDHSGDTEDDALFLISHINFADKLVSESRLFRLGRHLVTFPRLQYGIPYVQVIGFVLGSLRGSN